MAGFDLLSLLGSIPSLISDFSGNTSAPYQKQQKEIADRQNQYSQALTDVNNPLYQQLYGQYKQQNQTNMAQGIAEAQAQNRLNAGMGRVPLFNNERGSENIFRNLMQGYQNQGVQADQQTRQALQQGLQGNQMAQSQYGQISPYTIAANKQQNMGYQGIYDLLRGGQQSIMGGTSNQTPQQQNYNPGAIMWNQPRGSYNG